MDLSSLQAQYNITNWSESETLEWKLTTREIKETINTAVAFANTNGGTIIIGINDEGKIIGQDIADSTIREVTQTILANTQERLTPSIQKHEVEGVYILAINIPRSPLRPHLAYGRGYKRVGASSVQMNQAEYRVMLGHKLNGGGADKDIIPELKISDLNEEAINTFLVTCNNARNTNLPLVDDLSSPLTSLGLMIDGMLTKGALLLFGLKPQKYLPQSEIKLALFKDDTKKIFLDQQIQEGTLFEQFSGALTFARKHTPTVVNSEKLGNRVSEKVPAEVLKELIVNALVHRDYYSGASTYVEVFATGRIEISNPGSLPSPEIDINRLKSTHPSIPLNRRLARAFYNSGITEQWCVGCERATTICKELGLGIEWSDKDGVVKAVVSWANPV